MRKKDDDETEWYPQVKVTELTGCSASWVHAQGAKGTVRRREGSKWKGRPVYEYAYADVIREAGGAKVIAHRRAVAGEPRATPAVTATGAAAGVAAAAAIEAAVSEHRPDVKLPAIEWRVAVDLDSFVAWLREGLRLDHVTQDQARVMLVEKVKL